MKNLITICLIIFFHISSIDTFCQTKCKVLVPTISENYQGDCKKGLAHGKGIASGIDSYEGKFKKGYPDGKGIYKWENGDFYKGQWNKGQRNGEGDLHITVNGKDSLVSGIWKDDKYVGPKPILPTVKKNEGVARYTFKRLGDGNKVSIKIYQNGATNKSVSELFVSGENNGYRSDVGKTIIFQSIEVPFNCSIKYKTANSFRTNEYYVFFNFEISQPGNWELIIHN